MAINGQINVFIATKNYLSACEEQADRVVSAMRRDTGGDLDPDMEKMIYGSFLRAAIDTLNKQLNGGQA